jgi:hypothetical protein
VRISPLRRHDRARLGVAAGDLRTLGRHDLHRDPDAPRPPNDALERIDATDRSPLTIDEGIALITQHPGAVARNGGFSLPGSRCGDRRVCALWISEGRPKLGRCWAGNPHTWLRTASYAGRIGIPIPGG